MNKPALHVHDRPMLAPMMRVLKTWAEPLRPRMVPSFLVIGAQKSGTSTLFEMLAGHQQVLAPAVKEHHFFDSDEQYAKGIRAYHRGFPLRPLRTNDKVTFEATPNYLFHEPVAARIHKHLPHLRLIVVLRDPVSRAYSAWNMYRHFKDDPVHGHLHDPRSFEQAVEDELKGITPLAAHRYLARGYYAPQLLRYISLYGRDRLLVLKNADLDRDPAGVMAQCTSFLGLQPYQGDPQRLRVRRNVRPYISGMSPELHERLVTLYTPHMHELEGLLGPGWNLLP